MPESVPKHLKACTTFFYRRNKNTLLPSRPEYKTDHFFLVGAGTHGGCRVTDTDGFLYSPIYPERAKRFYYVLSIPPTRFYMTGGF